MDQTPGKTRWVARQMRGRIGSLLGFALAFHVIQVVLLAPLTAGMLRVFLEHWGRCSVGNFEIASFLLSLPGVAALLAVGSVTLATVYFELAGLAIVLGQRRPSCWTALRDLGRRLPGLLRLGLRQFAIYVLLALPFVGAAAGVLAIMWHGHDLNGLIVMKPPVFWGGAAAGGALLVIYLLLAARLFLRWILTIPILLLERDASAVVAMRRSVERTRGLLATSAAAIVAWVAIVVVVSAVVLGLLQAGAGWMLARAGMSLAVALPLTAAVLGVHWLVAALLSVAGVVGFAGLLLAIYRECGGDVVAADEPANALPSPAKRLPRRWAILAVSLGLLAIAALTCHGLLVQVRMEEQVQITAHRAGSSLAPENTVAAIRMAVQVHADWAEIDVQRTADGALVVVHDGDLLRVGGSKLRVAQSTLAEIRQVDVGRNFAAEFAGERVPTLDEAIAAAGDGVRLNIELKPHDRADVEPLVEAVLEAVRRSGIVERYSFCSQSYESLRLAKQHEPGLIVGFIAGAALGDLSKLDVDFLMVDAHLATRELVERAGVRGIAVYAWTINDPDKLPPLVDRGVANVITDDPVAMRSRLEEIRQLSPAERLLLRARNLLAD